MLETIKVFVAEKCEQQKTEQDPCRFTRREVRERTGWSETQIRLHLQRLEDFEYIVRRSGQNGTSYVYELLIDCHEPEGVYLIGLLDVDELRKKMKL